MIEANSSVAGSLKFEIVTLVKLRDLINPVCFELHLRLAVHQSLTIAAECLVAENMEFETNLSGIPKTYQPNLL